MDIKKVTPKPSIRDTERLAIGRWLGNIVRREVLAPKPGNKAWKRGVRIVYNWVFVEHWRLALNCLLALAIIAPIGWRVVGHFQLEQRYELSAATRKLIGPASTPLARQLKYNAKSQTYVFNQAAFSSSGSGADKVQLGSSAKNPLYGAKLAAASGTVTVADKTTGLSFGVTPLFSEHGGEVVANNGRPQKTGAAADHIVYPADDTIATTVYTIKNNGVKEDMVLSGSPSSGTITFSYKLNLPDTLQARLDTDGNLGIYSADPSLFGNITYGDSASEQSVMKARTNSPKNNLVFEIPAPLIYESGSLASDQAGSQAKFSLHGNILTVTATGLSDLHYPATIDPSVVVTAASDFQLGGNNEGDINFANNEISTSGLTGGTTGTWSTLTSLGQATQGMSSVAYNGYLYAVGGENASDSAYQTMYYDTINSDGTLGGTWQSGPTLPNPVAGEGVVAYNGYLYLIGGHNYTTYFNNVYYTPINSNGSLGSSWTPTNSFTTARANFGYAAYDGYLYIVGGSINSTPTSLADTQYASLNADGSVGSWATASATLPQAMDGQRVVAYNGYLYSMGGDSNNSYAYDADVYSISINSNGSLGSSWTAQNSLLTGTTDSGAAVYDGYIYYYGGYAYTTQNNFYNITEYAPINSNGALGTWQTTNTLNTASSTPGYASYNGYLYALGGQTGTSAATATVQYAQINPAGVVGSWGTSSSILTVTKGASAVAYNGYLYKLGGNNASGYYCDVEYAPINSNGTVGTWKYTYSSTSSTTYHCGFTTGRYWGEAIAYSGYLYILGGCSAGSCTTALNTVQYAPINSNGTIGTWASTTSFYTAVYGEAVTEYNGYLYLTGGATAGEVMQNEVEYAPINSNGTLGTWNYTYNSANNGSTQQGGFTTPRYGLAAVTYGGYLYIMGGCNDTNWYNDVQYAPINSNGTIGTWAGAGTFTNARYGLTAQAANGYLYIMGGAGTSFTPSYNDVQYASINNNGSLGSFQTTASFTNSRFDVTSAFYDGYLYLVGGMSAGGTYYAPVQEVSINNGGPGTTGTWQTNATSFTNTRTELASVAYNGYLYMLGGVANGTSYSDVQFAPLSSNGSVGAWQYTYNNTSGSTQGGGLPFAVGDHALVAYNGYLYVLGGYNYSTSTETNAVLFAPINSNGTIGAWQYTYNNTSGSTQGGGFTNARGGASAVAYNGYMYIMGGYGTSGSPYNDVQYAPINSNGTIGTWQSTTSFTTARMYFGTVVYNGYLYILGGHTSGTSHNDVQYAPINSNGTIGTWQYATSLNAASGLYDSDDMAMAYNGYIYILGGENDGKSSDYNDVQYAPINSNGSLGNWQNTTTFANARFGHGTAFYNGYVYIMGGNNYAQTTYYNDVQYAPLNSIPRIGQYSKLVDLTGAGTSGTPSEPLGTAGPTTTSGSSDTGNCNYMNMTEINTGSLAGSASSISVYISYAQVNDSNNYMEAALYTNVSGSPDLPGTLLASSTSQAVTPNAWNTFSISGATVTANTNYWIGFNPEDCNIQYGWAGTTGSGAGKAENITWESGVTYGTWPATWTYGSGSGGYTSGNGYAVYASISSVATGTAANDPLPTSFIMNGSNTGNPGYGQPGWPSGIAVSFALASSNCTTFGTSANLDSGPASPLGTVWRVGTLTPGGGCSSSGNGHYVWVDFTLNDSETATFPDSSGNHSSVSDFTLYYHPGSGSRLRGGATFSNGTLQSLDTSP